MAFLDNSGDIILDAVLTDTGRMRLAKGDGSFRVAKFALGDDEIDYSLYNKNSLSGTAYFDLEILQTPVLEAFSNNAASMKSKLISISRNNLYYLPVMKINTFTTPYTDATSLVQNGFILTADKDTEDYFLGKNSSGTAISALAKYNNQSLVNGVMFGFGLSNQSKYIRIDQGLDTNQIPAPNGIDPDLVEGQYIVEVDNRFATVVASTANDTSAPRIPSYIDDDNIATYYFTNSPDDADFVKTHDKASVVDSSQVIAGPRGTMFMFKLRSQSDLRDTDYLFNTLGTDITAGWTGAPATNVRGILTTIRVIGVTTGNSIDIPLMIVKKIEP